MYTSFIAWAYSVDHWNSCKLHIILYSKLYSLCSMLIVCENDYSFIITTFCILKGNHCVWLVFMFRGEENWKPTENRLVTVIFGPAGLVSISTNNWIWNFPLMICLLEVKLQSPAGFPIIKSVHDINNKTLILFAYRQPYCFWPITQSIKYHDSVSE